MVSVEFSNVVQFDMGHIALSVAVFCVVCNSIVRDILARHERLSLQDRIQSANLPEYKYQTKVMVKKPLANSRTVPTDAEMAQVEEEEVNRERNISNNNARVEEMLRSVKISEEKK